MGFIEGLKIALRITRAVTKASDLVDEKIARANRLIDAGQLDEARRVNNEARGANEVVKILLDAARG